MDKLVVPTPSNDVPFNWDDLDFFLGQEAYSKGLYQAIENILKAYGNNFIIYGVEKSGVDELTAGFVMLDGEILAVDQHVSSGSYFEKVTTNNPDGAKQTNLGGVVNIYKKNRAYAYGTGSPPTSNTLKSPYSISAGNPKRLADIVNGSYVTEKINTGAWDMDTSATLGFPLATLMPHITASQIRKIEVTIQPDTNASLLRVRQLSAAGNVYWGVDTVGDPEYIYLLRDTGGVFDGTNYNDPSMNRGEMFVTYEI